MIWREVIEGPRMRFLVLSRKEAREVAPQEPYIVIAIADRDGEHADLADSPHCLAVLRLRFDDTETTDFGGYPMTRKHALKIVRFVREYREPAQLIVCQCEQGISRSAAVAAALSSWIQKEDARFFRLYQPNRHVYRLILDVAYRSDLHSSVNKKNAQLIESFKQIGTSEE